MSEPAYYSYIGRAKHAIVIAIAMCFPLSALAACPPTSNPEDRVMIVQCTDSTYTIQEYDASIDRWVSIYDCGMDIDTARANKNREIVDLIVYDAIDCPPPLVQPKQPLVIVQ